MRRLDGPWPANSVLHRHMATANIMLVSLNGRLRVDYLVNGGASHRHAVQDPIGEHVPDIANVFGAMAANGADATEDERNELRNVLGALGMLR